MKQRFKAEMQEYTHNEIAAISGASERTIPHRLEDRMEFTSEISLTILFI